MSDRGSGTLLGLVFALVILSGGVISWCLVSIAVAHQRAMAAADLGALAAASAGCDEAARVVRVNGGQMEACVVEGADMVIEVSMPSPGPMARLGLPAVRVQSAARAGPG